MSNYPFWDLKVGVVGDTIKVQVKDEANNVYNYPLIQDTTTPILTGTVGLTTWGTEDVFWARLRWLGYAVAADVEFSQGRRPSD